MAAKKWSDLRPRTKRRYKAAGVTPAKFNAWYKKTPAQKRAATAAAKAAGFAGTGRERFLGLRPHQISGGDPTAAAFKALSAAFKDRPRYRPEGVRDYLARVRENEGLDRIKEIAGQSVAEVWAGTYPAVSKEESHHYHANS